MELSFEQHLALAESHQHYFLYPHPPIARLRAPNHILRSALRTPESSATAGLLIAVETDAVDEFNCNNAMHSWRGNKWERH